MVPCNVIVFEKVSKIGRTSSKTDSLPPTIVDNVPFLAPKSPPETGASNASQENFSASSAIFFAKEGVLVVKSMSILPVSIP